MGNIITLSWKGQDYTLNENEAFLAADAVEDHLTLGELVQMRADGNRIRFGKLSMAYAALLSEAGCTVTAQQVKKAFTDALKGEGDDRRIAVAVEAIDWLIYVLMDGAPQDGAEDKETKNEGASAS